MNFYFYPLFEAIALLPFVIGLVILLFSICICEARPETEWGTTINIVITGVFLYFVTTPTGAAYRWLMENPLNFFVGFLTYILLGGVYSVIKWWRFVRAYVEAAKAELDGRNLSSDNYRSRVIDLKNGVPKASRNKDRISTWILYWPLSLVAMLIKDLVLDFASWVRKQFTGVYESITSKAVSDLNDRLVDRDAGQ